MATKTLAGWPRVGEVHYQALPLLRFFAYKVRAREKVRKGEGEGDVAMSCYSASIVPPTCVTYYSTIVGLATRVLCANV